MTEIQNYKQKIFLYPTDTVQNNNNNVRQNNPAEENDSAVIKHRTQSELATNPTSRTRTEALDAAMSSLGAAQSQGGK